MIYYNSLNVMSEKEEKSFRKQIFDYLEKNILNIFK